jgi:peptide/nickel transport system substrate-binding protein
MQQKHRAMAAMIAVLAIVTAGEALAQKAKDTLRVALYQPIRMIDAIFNPQPETTLMASAVYDTLVFYDVDARKYRPLLARSWTRIDDKTVEFKLREDVKFHDGSDFDADDVVYSFNFVTDPNVAFRFKGTRFGWIDRVEKIDRYTVRIYAKRVYAPIFSRLSSTPPIYPSDVHGRLQKKNTFGRAPVGTGPYKAIQVDASRGVVLVRNEDYKHGGGYKPAGKIGRIEIAPLPDRQTQIARLLAGGQDLVYNVGTDLAQSLAANPDLKVSIQPTVSFVYVYFDVADRSGIGVFKNKNVRKAMLQAIDRKALRAAFLPKSIQSEPMQQALCHPWHVGCDFSASPPDTNLAEARRLLAAAGLGDGFDLKLTTWGPSVRIAEAVAGQLRRVGVRAKVDASTIGVFVKKRAQGKVQAFVSLWDNGGAQPDVDVTMGFFFLPGSRNYTRDKTLAAAVMAGRASYDLDKRKAIYRKAFDRVTNEYYMMPLMPIPAIVVHRKEVRILPGHKSPEGFEFNRIAWQ